MATEGMFQLETEGDAMSSAASDPLASELLTPSSVRAKSEPVMPLDGLTAVEADKDVCSPSTCSSPASEGVPSGSVTPTGGHTTTGRAKSDISLSRKAVRVEEVEPDCCAICLDNYSEEDPQIPCRCSHGYHLQCIYSWAQRSRECPLCFKPLALEDPDLHEMLPFGEYISPQQAAAASASVESWDLERLLVQLAAANQRQERRAAREARHRRRAAAAAAAAAAAGDGQSSTPQPIRHASSDAGSLPPVHRYSLEGATTSSSGSGLQRTPPRAVPAAPHSPSTPAGAFPASWPPASSRTLAARAAAEDGPGSSSGSRPQGPGISPSLKAASQSIKKGFAALKIRESFSKTEAKLKAMFSNSDRRPDRPAA
ncbi:hypothetical protein N2152v2_008837 [Parachlorella kessleri]